MKDQLLEEQAQHEDAILRAIRDLEDILGQLRVNIQCNDDVRIEKALQELVVLATPLQYANKVVTHASAALLARKLLHATTSEKRSDLTTYSITKGYNRLEFIRENIPAQELAEYMKSMPTGKVIQVVQYYDQWQEGIGRYIRLSRGLFQAAYEDLAIEGLLKHLGLPEEG